MSKSMVNLACAVWAAFFLLTIIVNVLSKNIASYEGILIGSGALIGIGTVALCINLFIPANGELTNEKPVSHNLSDDDLFIN